MSEDTGGTRHAAEPAERAADQADGRARDADRNSRWAVAIMVGALLGLAGLAIQNERIAASLRVEIAGLREDLRAEIATVRADLQGEIAYRLGQLAGMTLRDESTPETATAPSGTDPEAEPDEQPEG